MGWKAVSAGADRDGNEDAVMVLEHGGVTDIVVLDGATSVAQQQYVDRQIGDVAWFVRSFREAFKEALARPGSQEAMVRAALERTRAAFEERTAGQAVPVYAWPLAAMTWVRVLPAAGRSAVELIVYCLGDCKTLLRQPDGSVIDLDPWTNPQEAVLLDALEALAREGVVDPDARRARMLPMLRRRREEQNRAPSPAALVLVPAGPFAARRYAVRAEPGALLLVMTDGFYRLVQPYGIYSDEGLLQACASAGPEALLAELRAWEQGKAGGALALKQSDDASAVAWTFD